MRCCCSKNLCWFSSMSWVILSSASLRWSSYLEFGCWEDDDLEEWDLYYDGNVLLLEDDAKFGWSPPNACFLLMLPRYLITSSHICISGGSGISKLTMYCCLRSSYAFCNIIKKLNHNIKFKIYIHFDYLTNLNLIHYRCCSLFLLVGMGHGP